MVFLLPTMIKQMMITWSTLVTWETPFHCAKEPCTCTSAIPSTYLKWLQQDNSPRSVQRELQNVCR